MKQKLKTAAAALALCLLLTGTPAYGAAAPEQTNLKIIADGQEITGNKTLLVDGTTYVPLRTLGEALDKIVRYDAANQTIYIQSKSPERIAVEKSFKDFWNQLDQENYSGAFNLLNAATQKNFTADQFVAYYQVRSQLYHDNWANITDAALLSEWHNPLDNQVYQNVYQVSYQVNTTDKLFGGSFTTNSNMFFVLEDGSWKRILDWPLDQNRAYNLSGLAQYNLWNVRPANTAKAAEYLQQARQLAPDEIWINLDQAACEALSGQNQPALDLVGTVMNRTAVMGQDELADKLKHSGYYYFSAQDPGPVSALQSYCYTIQGIAYHNLGQTALAQAALEKALQVNPDNPEALSLYNQ